jgi:hypothetical protein
MKLKPIEENMVVHCSTEDEAKELIKWAYECGYRWYLGKSYDTFFDINFPNRSYHFHNKCEISCSNNFKQEDEEVLIEFSDLIIPEEQDEHMSAEEIVKFLLERYNDGTYKEVFGADYNVFDLYRRFSPKEIVSKIESYEAKKKQEKEVEVEWVYKVYDFFGNTEVVYDEDTAIERCEELAKANPDKFSWYDNICRVKNEENK